ncbi:MAG: hypothetical protein JSR60_13240 [Proteobacteria bacterium]|nr:hypothetical protein [Pseudomonadota bacterium]
MRRLLALIALTFAVLAGSAAMAEEKPGDPGTNVEMPFLIAPLSVDGKLYGYAYISLKAVTASPTDALRLRDKIAFVQDAFVRDVNAAPIGKSDDPKSVDEPALANRLLADARKVLGAKTVARILLIQVKITPIHPGDMTPADPDQTAEPAG